MCGISHGPPITQETFYLTYLLGPFSHLFCRYILPILAGYMFSVAGAMWDAGLAVLFCSLATVVASDCMQFRTTRRFFIERSTDHYLETYFREGQLLDRCGHVYFISKYRITEERLLDFCAALKMSPVLVEDENEATCLAGEMKKGSFGHELTFWLPAIGTNGDYKWCRSQNNESRIPKENFIINEAPYEVVEHLRNTNPEIAELRCLKLHSYNGSRLVLAEEICTTSFERFLCKKKREEYFDVFPGDEYQNLTQCRAEENGGKLKTIRDALEVMTDKNSSFLELEDNSFVHRACGKVYFIDALTTQWKLAMTECCSLGLKGLKIVSKEEMNCLTKALAESEDFNTFWIGAYNSGNKSEFKWLDGSLVDNSLWALHQPEKPQVYRCVTLNVEEWQTELTGLQDTNCEAELPVICEL